MSPGNELPLLALEHVSVHFEGLRALDDVSFDVSSGEIVGLIGPNGAGKTTAFNVACGFVKAQRRSRALPDRQEVEPAAEPVGARRRRPYAPGRRPLPALQRARERDGRRSPSTEWRLLRQLLVAAQGGPLGTGPSRDALAMLERLNIADMANRLPSAIPYGIAKKVSVARALMSDPTLLMLDEPASGLDEAELDDFARLIVELRSTMGVLLVEHDMEFVMPLVDRLVVLNFGEVIATGSPADVRENAAVIEAYLGVDE
jgi:branched-chain amino acid transport system ATP-binding protein